MPFSNATIDIDLLPSVEQSVFNQLENGYKKVIFYENLIVAVFLIGGLSAIYFMDGMDDLGQYWFIPFLLVGLLLLFLFWFRPKAFARKGYQLREKDLVYQSGLWWQSETVIPFVRVQHSEVTQGPLGRLFGFSTLKLFTAGGSKSDLAIPALHPETASKLETFVSQKAGLVKDEQ